MSLLRSYLEANAILSSTQLEAATRHQQAQGGSLDTALLELGLLGAGDLDLHLGRACGLPTVPARLLETGPTRPWGHVPKALLDIGWAMPLALEDGHVLVAVHPDLPDARLGQLYRQIRGFMPMVAPECCLAKLAAERSNGIVAPRFAMLMLDVLDALQAREAAPPEAADRSPADRSPAAPEPADPASSGSFAIASNLEPGTFAASSSGSFPDLRSVGAHAPGTRHGPSEPPSSPAAGDPPVSPASSPAAQAGPAAAAPPVSPASSPAAQASPAAAAPPVSPASSPAAQASPAAAPPVSPASPPAAQASAAAPAPAMAAADVPRRVDPGSSLSAPVMQEPGRADELARRLAPARAVLAEARERDRITGALVRAAAQIAPRVALFGVRREGLRALAIPGALQLPGSLVIPIPEGSLLDRAVAGLIRLKLLTEPKLAAAVGRPLGIPCLFEPVFAQERGVLMLYIDRDGGLFDAADHIAVRELCDLAGASLEALLRLRGVPGARPVEASSAANPAGDTIVGPAPLSPAAIHPAARPTDSPAAPATLASVPVPQDSHSAPAAPDRLTEAAPQDSRTAPAAPDSPPEAVPQDSRTAPAAPDSPPEVTPQGSHSPPVSSDSLPEAVPQDSNYPSVSSDSPPEAAPQDSRTAPVPSDSPPEAAPQDLHTTPVSSDSLAAPAPTDSPAATDQGSPRGEADAPQHRPGRAARAAKRQVIALVNPIRRDTSGGYRSAPPPETRASEASSPASSRPLASAPPIDPDHPARPELPVRDPSVATDSPAAAPSPAQPVLSDSPVESRGAPQPVLSDSPADADVPARAPAQPQRRDDSRPSAISGEIIDPPPAPVPAHSPPPAPVPADSPQLSPAAAAAPDQSTDRAPEAPGSQPEPVHTDSPAAAPGGLHLPNLVAPPGARRGLGKKGQRARPPEPGLVMPDLRRPVDPSAATPILSMPTSLIAPTPLPGTQRRGSRTGQYPVPPRADEITLNMPTLVRRDAGPRAPVSATELSPATATPSPAHPLAGVTIPADLTRKPAPTAASPTLAASPTPAATAPDPAADASATSDTAMETSATDFTAETSATAAVIEAIAGAMTAAVHAADHEDRLASTSPPPDERPAAPARDVPAPLDVDAVIEAYLNDPEAAEARAALTRLGPDDLARVAARFPGPIDLGDQTDARSFPPPSAHGPLLRACVDIGPPITPHILELLEYPRPQLRFYAAFVFQELRDPRCMRALAEHTFDPDADVRLIATRVLESYSRVDGFLAATELVRAELRSRDRERALLAAEAAGTLRDTQAVYTLIELLSVRDKQVRETALEALCSITAKHLGYRPAKWRAWYDEHGQETRVEWVIEALRHRDAAVRRWAADELVRITGHRVTAPAGEKLTAKYLLHAWQEWWKSGAADRPA